MKNNISYEINNENPEDKKKFIQKLFNSIVPTYDLLNHLLSMGTDKIWRNNIFKIIKDVKNNKVIDLCCGTGDLSFILHKKGAQVVSLDFSMNMLEKGIHKKAIKGFPIAADASKIPFSDNSFSTATIAFGIRNIPDIDNFIREAYRVLKPKGELVILELVRPKNKLVNIFYSFYLGKLLPFIGGLVSGKKSAYTYLAGTIKTFIDPDDLQIMLKKKGFKKSIHSPQTFGVATIMVYEK